MTLLEPTRNQVLEYCAHDPVERVFLEEIARRKSGHFTGLEREGRLAGLCHVGTNVVPSGEGCEAFAQVAARSGALMLLGEERAVTDLWTAARARMPPPREDRPGQPVYVCDEPPEPGGSGLRAATLRDVDVLMPRVAAAHTEELGTTIPDRDLRLRTRVQVDEGRSWLWLEDGVVLFKAEASAWTPEAVQLSQVWTDPEARGHGYAQRALRDLIRLLLSEVPCVTLFVRTDNAAAIRLYERVGMRRALTYRSVLF